MTQRKYFPLHNPCVGRLLKLERTDLREGHRRKWIGAGRSRLRGGQGNHRDGVVTLLRDDHDVGSVDAHLD